MRANSTHSKMYSPLVVALLLASCATPPSGERVDNLPMYGQPQLTRPDALKKADEEFINQAAAGLGSREQASKAWAAQADRFMAQGNLDFAMRRYNQSWLLNPSNYQPHWGFGRVLIERGKVDAAIEHLERANQLVDDPYQRVALLADTGTAYSIKADQTPASRAAERARNFQRANRLYEESVAADPKYGNAWSRWASSLYFEGRYAEAWEKVNKARSLDASAVPPAFLRALASKMPEPK